MEDELLERLAGKNPDELRAARAAIDTLLGTSSGSRRVLIELGDAVLLDVFSDALKARGIDCPPPVVAAKLPHAKSLRGGCEVVKTFVDDVFNPRSRGARVKSYRILVDLVLAHLDRIGVPVSHSTLSKQLGKAPALVERAFPGYRAAGLLPAVLLARKASA